MPGKQKTWHSDCMMNSMKIDKFLARPGSAHIANPPIATTAYDAQEIERSIIYETAQQTKVRDEHRLRNIQEAAYYARLGGGDNPGGDSND